MQHKSSNKRSVKQKVGSFSLLASLVSFSLSGFAQQEVPATLAGHSILPVDSTTARILEFDVKKQDWTGRSWLYVFEDNQNAIGDFNLIDETHGLIIERDNGEGTSDKACATGSTNTENCFSNLAKFKRVYGIAFSDENVGGMVDKQAYIDLMNIKDPNSHARKPLNDGVFTFPFFTIVLCFNKCGHFGKGIHSPLK